MQTYKFIVKGKVQGVWYRASIKKVADEYELRGYAKNLDDGSVEVIINLNKDMLSKIKRAIYMGSPNSEVRSVENLETKERDFDDFSIK